MSILKELEGKTVKQTFFGREYDVEITNVIEEDEECSEYLDGSYTREELIELAEEMGGNEKVCKVYGKIKDYDVDAITALQELAKQDFYRNLSSSGCPFIERDYKNELLLKIFRDGDEPQY